MNKYSSDFAMVFLIITYFLTGIVMSLAILYFSRSRPKNRVTENKSGSLVKTKTPKADIPVVSGKKRSFGETLPFIKKSDSSSQPSKELKKEGLIVNNPNISENVIAEKAESPKEKNGNGQKVDLNGNLFQSMRASPKLDTPTDRFSIQEKSMDKENPALSNVPDVSGTQAHPIISPTSDQKLQNLETAKSAPAKEVKTEAGKVPTAPLIKIVNENSLKTGKEDKSNNINTANDFSQLFTDQDIEENEATKLAKELNDIETSDILEESRDLINQFKRNRS